MILHEKSPELASPVPQNRPLSLLSHGSLASKTGPRVRIAANTETKDDQSSHRRYTTFIEDDESYQYELYSTRPHLMVRKCSWSATNADMDIITGLLWIIHRDVIGFLFFVSAVLEETGLNATDNYLILKKSCSLAKPNHPVLGGTTRHTHLYQKLL